MTGLCELIKFLVLNNQLLRCKKPKPAKNESFYGFSGGLFPNYLITVPLFWGKIRQKAVPLWLTFYTQNLIP